jgi:hypothetical protein
VYYNSREFLGINYFFQMMCDIIKLMYKKEKVLRKAERNINERTKEQRQKEKRSGLKQL